MVLPNGKDHSGIVALVSPPTSYQLALLLFLTKGYELRTRAILDTGSGPSLVRKLIFPQGFPLEPFGDLE